jgi:dethiobiotin synthetase
MKGVFVTGTDTGIGKTLTCAFLAAALKAYNKSVVYYKPIQTGTDDDTKTASELSGVKTISPAYSFKEPASPHKAAKLENINITISEVSLAAVPAGTSFVIVEGAGGLLVPLNNVEAMRDLVKYLEIPLLIVASTKLGPINHTLLTLEAARAAGIRVVGVILNGPEDQGLAQTIAEMGRTKIIAQIPKVQPSKVIITDLAPNFFTNETLDELMDSQ